MIKKKIVYIDIPPGRKRLKEEQEIDKWINGWGSLLGRNILKYTDEFEIETWHYDNEVNKIESKIINNIKGVRFPITKFSKSSFPYSMYRILLDKFQKKEPFLVHVSFIFNMFCYSLVYLLGNKIPFIVSSHGDMRADLKYKIYKKRKYLIERNIVAPKALKKVSYATCLRKDDKEYLQNYIKKENLIIQTVGVDFNKFKPLDKNRCRKEFNLPLDKKLLLYIGRLYKLKGIHLILPLIEKLRKRNIELVVVGADPNQELYDEFRKKNVIIFGRMPHHQIPKILSSVDAYTTPGHNQKYRGLDVANLEALACNIPVISPNINHLPGHYNTYGYYLQKEDDLFHAIIKVVLKSDKNSNIRENIKPIISWESIVKRMISVYNSFLT